MYKAIVIRLFPTKSQADLLWQNVGTVRWTWNWGLALQKKTYSESGKILNINALKRKFTEVRNSAARCKHWNRRRREIAGCSELWRTQKSFQKYQSKS